MTLEILDSIMEEMVTQHIVLVAAARVNLAAPVQAQAVAAVAAAVKVNHIQMKTIVMQKMVKMKTQMKPVIQMTMTMIV